MTVNQKVTGTASTMPGGLAIGGLISLTVTLAGSVLCGVLASKEVIAESGIGYCALAILLASSAFGAVVAVGKIKHRRLLVCMLSGAVYYGALLALTALFFGGQYQGMGVTAIVVMSGCTLVALFGMKQGRRGTPRRHKTVRR